MIGLAMGGESERPRGGAEAFPFPFPFPLPLPRVPRGTRGGDGVVVVGGGGVADGEVGNNAERGSSASTTNDL